MEDIRNNDKAELRSLLICVAISLAVTLLTRIITVISTELFYEESTVTRLLDILMYVLDAAIYAAGAAAFLRFICTGNKKFTYYALTLVLLILAFDFAASFIMDLVSDKLHGVELLTALLLFLNFSVRALTCLLLIWFAPVITKGCSAALRPIPFFSGRHSVSRLILASALVHMVPYLITEVSANVNGIIDYGMPSAIEVLAIVSAYGEIFLKGIVVYFTAFIILSLMTPKPIKE